MDLYRMDLSISFLSLMNCNFYFVDDSIFLIVFDFFMGLFLNKFNYVKYFVQKNNILYAFNILFLLK